MEEEASDICELPWQRTDSGMMRKLLLTRESSSQSGCRVTSSWFVEISIAANWSSVASMTIWPVIFIR